MLNRKQLIYNDEKSKQIFNRFVVIYFLNLLKFYNFVENVRQEVV